MSYRINPISGELSEYAFDFGGVVMLRNFTARVDGERLIIHSSENQNFSILDALVSEVEIDGVVYDNPTKAQEVLQRLVFNANTPVVLPQEERNLISKIGNKIDKIEGKGLSTNDFTDELKTLVESAALTYIQKGGFTGTAQDLKNALDNVLTILNSPDTELDELKEIVPYIKQNKKILSTLSISNIAGLVDALRSKAEATHNHNETYYTKDEVLELTNKTPLITPLTYFKTTKVFTEVGGGVQYGNTTLLMNPGQNHTIEIVKEGARKIFRYVKLDDGEVNFTSSSEDGDFVVEYTTSDTILRKGGEAIVVLNGTNAWISINNEKSNPSIDNLQIGGENLISGGRHFVKTGTNGEIFSPILHGGLTRGKTYILNAEKVKGSETKIFSLSKSQHYESTTHQDIEIGIPFVANNEHTYLWVYPDNNGEIEYKNVILQEGNVGTSFVPERGADSGISEEEKQALGEAKSLRTEVDTQKEKLNNISFSDIKNIPPNLAESEIKDTIQTIDNQTFELGNVNTSNASELNNDSTGLEGFKFWRTKFAELIEFSDKHQYEINFNTEHTLFLKILWFDEEKQYISSSQYKGITYVVTKPPKTTRYARIVLCFDDFISGDISMLHLSIKKLALPVLFNKIGESIGNEINKNLNTKRLYTSQKIYGNTTYYCVRTNVEFNVDNIFDGEISYIYKDVDWTGNITFSTSKNKTIRYFNGFNPSQEVNNLNEGIGSYAKIIGNDNKINIYIFNY